MSRGTRTVDAADGTRLTFRVKGQGPPLVLANGVSTSHFFWRKILPRWTTRYRVVFWDYKGHGDSEPAATKRGATVEGFADDLIRVMDAAGIERAPVIGFSMGSQVAIEACRHRPERFAALVSLLGTVGKIFDTALWTVGGKAMQAVLRATPRRAHRGLRRAVWAGLQMPGTYRAGRVLGLFGDETAPADIAAYVEHFGRLDPSTVADVVLAAGRHDASDVLRQLAVPLLVIAGDKDVFAPSDRVSRPIHEAAPHSQLVVLPQGTHGSLFGHVDEIEAAIDRFLHEIAPQRDWDVARDASG